MGKVVLGQPHRTESRARNFPHHPAKTLHPSKDPTEAEGGAPALMVAKVSWRLGNSGFSGDHERSLTNP